MTRSPIVFNKYEFCVIKGNFQKIKKNTYNLALLALFIPNRFMFKKKRINGNINKEHILYMKLPRLVRYKIQFI